MTATEVARNFASVLDRAEHGETIVITRGGRRLATLAPTPAGNGAAIKAFLESHPVDEDLAHDVALVHARLLAHVRREGKPRGAHDLIIAATAAATARTLLTTDGKTAFDDLPGVHAAVIPA
ncbi:type II toxin-antitoxin system prevent-host-death family antitoxin [Streptomyces sedi]|uniref:Type II toxin-antitoxin system prevent-host-death family antitoxin n=2 Tax=Streptomyces sedi TaxID=555059 RepID=A0A5C4VAM6_9ACTN|nr:type II toxin-antitoxin system prevent-host-death family antitoxin [Streptomyces sedi]TNM32984.1 type II toxin-antitoxin system prevent-host-death family antitoxin [Streptomyces sedi]